MSEKPVTVEFGIIHDWDPEAANDDCYVTSSDSIELRAISPISSRSHSLSR
jgi:hypothetical protein